MARPMPLLPPVTMATFLSCPSLISPLLRICPKTSFLVVLGHRSRNLSIIKGIGSPENLHFPQLYFEKWWYLLYRKGCHVSGRKTWSSISPIISESNRAVPQISAYTSSLLWSSIDVTIFEFTGILSLKKRAFLIPTSHPSWPEGVFLFISCQPKFTPALWATSSIRMIGCTYPSSYSGQRGDTVAAVTQ